MWKAEHARAVEALQARVAEAARGSEREAAAAARLAAVEKERQQVESGADPL